MTTGFDLINCFRLPAERSTASISHVLKYFCTLLEFCDLTLGFDHFGAQYMPSSFCCDFTNRKRRMLRFVATLTLDVGTGCSGQSTHKGAGKAEVALRNLTSVAQFMSESGTFGSFSIRTVSEIESHEGRDCNGHGYQSYGW